MAEIEENLATYLNSGLSVKAYPLRKPLEDNNCVVYRRISTRKNHIVDTDLSKSNIRARFLFTCWNTTYTGVKTLARQVDNLIDTSSGSWCMAVQIDNSDIEEIDKNLYRADLNYWVFYNE